MQIEHLDDVTGGIMTPEHRAQMRRLAGFRESAVAARERAAQEEAATTPLTTGSSEARAAQGSGEDDGNDNYNENADKKPQDPLIYPGLYSPSGFNIINILIRVHMRPNPTIDLGAIDSSCALVLCDLSLPDAPIVYASEPFTALTHYAEREILGRNCRFLQAPSGRVARGARRPHSDDDAVRELRDKLARREECQVSLTNYKKGGERFENILTVVPIRGGAGAGVGAGSAAEDGVRFVVGFQVDRRECFLGPAVAPAQVPEKGAQGQGQGLGLGRS